MGEGEEPLTPASPLPSPSPIGWERAGVREQIGGSVQMLPNTQSLRAWADRFLDRIGYMTELRRVEKKDEAAESRMRNIQALIGTLDSKSDGPVSAPLERLQNFLEEITLDSDRQEEAVRRRGEV